MSTPKYYFGYYNWHGRWCPMTWDADAMPHVESDHKVLISKEEWEGPLVILEYRYASLRPQEDST